MTKEQLAKLGITTDKDTLTDDEVIALLEPHIKGKDDEITKLKKSVSDGNTENANQKRKIKELEEKVAAKMTDDEKEKARIQAIEEENASLKKAKALSDKVNDLMGLGYSKELATEYATAELDGKPTIEFQKKFLEEQRKAVEAEILNKGKKPKTDDNPKTYTVDDFKKMGLEELTKLHDENPTLYAELEAKAKE